jgi:HxlR-like helix-turn-helix
LDAHIVRDLLTGTSRFNDLVRGNPGLSRALLSRRLDQLERAGRDLQPVIFGLAEWGARWAFGEPDPDELDADLLLWWLHRRLNPDTLPGHRFVIYLHFTDDPKRYWIVVETEASLCLTDPGFDVDLTLRSELSTLYRTYLGHQTLSDAFHQGQLHLSGSNAAPTSAFAPPTLGSSTVRPGSNPGGGTFRHD